MTAPQLTSPILSGNASVWFSAYGFGWGYRAFSLPPDVVCDVLGAANNTPKQLRLAFELGKHRILPAIEHITPPMSGERITLHAADLQQ